MKPQLILFNDDGQKEINIYINGFNQNKNDLIKSTSRINSLELPGKVYQLFWSSNISFPKPLLTTARIGGKLMKFSLLPQPYLADLIVDGGSYAAEVTTSWLYAKGVAEELGYNLKRYISHIPKAHEYPINLIGHSLGARIIHWALYYNSWDDYKINDVILLGGATDSESGDWEDCAEEINGRLINIYSTKDKVLRIKPDREKNIGSYPIEEDHDRIENYEYDYSHGEYIENIVDVYDDLFPHRRRSKHYFGFVEIECPWCEESFYGTPNVPVRCPNCSLDFIYDLRNDDVEYPKEYPEPIDVDCPHCEKDTFPVQQSADYECTVCGEETYFERDGDTVYFDCECEECEGEGVVDCEECEGEGEFDCKECEGNGEVECEECEGEGETECNYCEGEGCGHCDDTGFRECKACEGEGEVECDECEGEGVVECEECEGEGEVECDECDGEGELTFEESL